MRDFCLLVAEGHFQSHYDMTEFVPRSFHFRDSGVRERPSVLFAANGCGTCYNVDGARRSPDQCEPVPDALVEKWNSDRAVGLSSGDLRAT